MPLPARVLNPLPAVTQLLTSGAALNPSSRYAACGPPPKKATGISRPIDGDGTIKLSNPGDFVVPVEPDIALTTHHPAVSAMTQNCRKREEGLFISASHIYTGSNCEM